LYYTANFICEAGHPSKGIPLLESALHNSKKLYGEQSSPEVADLLYSFATLHEQMAQYSQVR
jgi:hypothetical protein